MPNLRRTAESGFQAVLDTVFPALTCSVQSSLLTGLLPTEHGIVGNGWYFRDIGDVLLWRQHNRLVAGEKLWDTARLRHPGYTTANVCWWYAIGATTDVTVTPRPIYHADGRKSPDCYTIPADLHEKLTTELGPFPLFSYWGPTAGIASSRWIIRATQRVLDGLALNLTLVYVPHLDYELQRFGPNSSHAVAAAQEVDRVLAPLLVAALTRSVTIVVLSEYGITEVRRPVDINRALRRAGLLEVYTQGGMEYLDQWTSKAFAVADHQIAHVYIRDHRDIPVVRGLISELPGVDEVLDDSGKVRCGVAHERAGELLAIAERDAWFTYYYWLDDDRSPDFARTVEIHRKPGYDPAELFFDPADRLVKLRAAFGFVRKKLALRYAMNLVPLDPSCVRGSHGRLPDEPQDWPVLLCSNPTLSRDRIHATDVKEFLLGLAGLPAAEPSR
jgi:predicted AlkP superfamily pyrophosphatase or phosphodiesterase